jgi:hypothetical protein
MPSVDAQVETRGRGEHEERLQAQITFQCIMPSYEKNCSTTVDINLNC